MENIISEERWNAMSEGEQTTLFLVNSLRMLDNEQLAILSRGLLDRIEEESFRRVVYDSAISRGYKTLEDVTPDPVVYYKDKKLDKLFLDAVKQIVEEGFEEYLNGETVDKIGMDNVKDGVKISVDIYDNNRDCIFNNEVFVKFSGIIKVSLHEAYEGCGIEEHVSTNILKLIGC